MLRPCLRLPCACGCCACGCCGGTDFLDQFPASFESLTLAKALDVAKQHARHNAVAAAVPTAAMPTQLPKSSHTAKVPTCVCVVYLCVSA